MDDDFEQDDPADGGQLEQQVARLLPLRGGAPAQAPENEDELGDGERRNRKSQPRPQTPDAGVAEQQKHGGHDGDFQRADRRSEDAAHRAPPRCSSALTGVRDRVGDQACGEQSSHGAEEAARGGSSGERLRRRDHDQQSGDAGDGRIQRLPGVLRHPRRSSSCRRSRAPDVRSP